MADDTAQPVLIYDDDCSFCRTWIGFWRVLTGDRIEYLPYQQASERFPDIPVDDCREAVQLVTPEGRFARAEAVARVLADVPGYRWMYWCYRHVPGFAFLASLKYRFIARHRNFASRMTRLLWGEQVVPTTFHTASELFSRVLAIVYAIAFMSFGLQLRGLVGSEGIIPAREFLDAVHQQLGGAAMWRLPTLFWWGSSDLTMLSITWGGVALSLISLLTKQHSGRQRLIFIVLWAYYLSIVNAGQVFMSFQWDWLLVEVGFLSIFLQPTKPRVWLFRWLLFRLMLDSGIVKLASGDHSWRHLTALNFHYWTQPLPTPLAWYANLAPAWFQSASVVMVFVVELFVPFLMWAPRRLRHLAGFTTIGLQTLILLTGNYTFFNLLTIALCLFLFDDLFFTRLKLATKPLAGKAPLRAVTVAISVLVLSLSAVDFAAMAGKLPAPVARASSQISQFGIVNHYGLFAVMTTQRLEIQIEGSQDGQKWAPYLFRYKPGPENRSLPWVEPYQPRLDWQMWFAALSPARENPWFIRLMVGLLHGSKSINDLFEATPFQGAPKMIRATIYEYHFTTWDERSKTGNIWKRELKGLYFPPVSIRAGQ